MNCYFCHQKLICRPGWEEIQNFICNHNGIKVKHIIYNNDIVEGIYWLVKMNKSIYQIHYRLVDNNCSLYSVPTEMQRVHIKTFNYIPDWTPENSTNKIRTVLTFL